MDLRSLIRAHAEWIVLFREALFGEETLTVGLAADDGACELGRWLRDHEQRLGHLAEFRAAFEAHARFHGLAAECLLAAQGGHRSEALAMTAEDGELRRQSQLLVQAVQALQDKVPGQAEQRRAPRSALTR